MKTPLEPTRPVGELLQRAREARKMTLAEVARVTRIPVQTLTALEEGNTAEYPSEVFVRGFLRAFAMHVGLAPEDVVLRYQEGRRREQGAPTLVQAALQLGRERPTRRFGVAIAFVLLLVLFTLALSIVLKPRGHEIPAELSLHAVERSPLS